MPLSRPSNAVIEEEEETIEKLEVEVEQMAQKILEFRTKLPDQLKATLASVLGAQRPVLPNLEAGNESGESSSDVGRQVESSGKAIVTEREGDKIQLLRHKLSSNVSTIPILLKRMTECISKIDNLNSHDEIIHPAFKKKRTS